MQIWMNETLKLYALLRFEAAGLRDSPTPQISKYGHAISISGMDLQSLTAVIITIGPSNISVFMVYLERSGNMKLADNSRLRTPESVPAP